MVVLSIPVYTCFLCSFFDRRTCVSAQSVSGRVVIWIFVGLLSSQRTYSGSLAVRIWNLAVPIPSSEGNEFLRFALVPLVTLFLLRDVVHILSCLPHHVNVLQWPPLVAATSEPNRTAFGFGSPEVDARARLAGGGQAQQRLGLRVSILEVPPPNQYQT